MKPRLTQLKSIRWHCLDCSVGNPAEVAVCNIKECALWEFRFGISPKDEDIVTASEIGVLRGTGNPEFTPSQRLDALSDDEKEARRTKYRDWKNNIEKARRKKEQK